MDWIMAHPWLTFILGILTLVVIDGAVLNICKVALAKIGVDAAWKSAMLEMEAKEHAAGDIDGDPDA